jgi:hypothetical protein
VGVLCLITGIASSVFAHSRRIAKHQNVVR